MAPFTTTTTTTCCSLLLIAALAHSTLASPLRVAVDGEVGQAFSQAPKTAPVAPRTTTGGTYIGEEDDPHCLDVKMKDGYSGTVCGVNTTVPHKKKCMIMLPGEFVKVPLTCRARAAE